MVFRPSRVLSCVMFCLDEIVSLSLSKPLRGGLDLLRLVSLGWSRQRSRSARRSTSLDSPRWGTLWASLSRFPWSIGGLFSGSSSSVALVSVVSLLGGVSLSIPLLWVTLWPSLSLSIPLVGGSGHLRDASLGGSHWRPICRRRSLWWCLSSTDPSLSLRLSENQKGEGLFCCSCMSQIMIQVGLIASFICLLCWFCLSVALLDGDGVLSGWFSWNRKGKASGFFFFKVLKMFISLLSSIMCHEWIYILFVYINGSQLIFYRIDCYQILLFVVLVCVYWWSVRFMSLCHVMVRWNTFLYVLSLCVYDQINFNMFGLCDPGIKRLEEGSLKRGVRRNTG